MCGSSSERKVNPVGSALHASQISGPREVQRKLTGSRIDSGVHDPFRHTRVWDESSQGSGNETRGTNGDKQGMEVACVLKTKVMSKDSWLIAGIERSWHDVSDHPWPQAFASHQVMAGKGGKGVSLDKTGFEGYETTFTHTEHLVLVRKTGQTRVLDHQLSIHFVPRTQIKGPTRKIRL